MSKREHISRPRAIVIYPIGVIGKGGTVWCSGSSVAGFPFVRFIELIIISLPLAEKTKKKKNLQNFTEAIVKRLIELYYNNDDIL